MSIGAMRHKIEIQSMTVANDGGGGRAKLYGKQMHTFMPKLYQNLVVKENLVIK